MLKLFEFQHKREPRVLNRLKYIKIGKRLITNAKFIKFEFERFIAKFSAAAGKLLLTANQILPEQWL